MFYALHVKQIYLRRTKFFQIFLYAMFVSIMAFFARVSDPAVGGTYMTLLNTLTNLGGNWPATLALWFEIVYLILLQLVQKNLKIFY